MLSQYGGEREGDVDTSMGREIICCKDRCAIVSVFPSLICFDFLQS